jgi:hypothetical protein
MSSRRYRSKAGRDWTRWHIAQAGAFSAQVDGSDRIVKDVFFRLAGPALVAFFTVYRRRYGAEAAMYAYNTREKWRRGEVRISAVVSQRLYSIMPPFMSSDEKRQVIEVLWKRYATVVRQSAADTNIPLRLAYRQRCRRNATPRRRVRSRPARSGLHRRARERYGTPRVDETWRKKINLAAGRCRRRKTHPYPQARSEAPRAP